MSALLQVLAGVSIRLSMYHDGIFVFLRYSKCFGYWQYLDCLDEIINKFNDDTARYNVGILLCYHFFGFDRAALCEVADLRGMVMAKFDSHVQLVINTIFSWYKGVQDKMAEALSDVPVDQLD
jgi:hypothetical protein